MLMSNRAGQDRGAAVAGRPFAGEQSSERGIGEPAAEQPECPGAGLAAGLELAGVVFGDASGAGTREGMAGAARPDHPGRSSPAVLG